MAHSRPPRTPPPEPAGHSSAESSDLIIEGARQHNLKNVTLRIPHEAVTVITGVSGSGKSSLAFDTLFAEGQWRYIESLSTYTRMFLERLDRPDVDRLRNIRPAIAIEQKNPVRTARSTVGTSTETADLLRLLFAKVGHISCSTCNVEARRYDPGAVADELLARFPDGRAMVLSPIVTETCVEGLAASLLRKGFVRVLAGETVLDLQPELRLPRTRDLCVILDRLVLRLDNRTRLLDAIETAFQEAGGRCEVAIIGQGRLSYTNDFRCQGCGSLFAPLRPVLFSFNHPLGACPECRGFGNVLRYDEDLVIPDKRRTLAEGAVEPWTKPGTDWWQQQMLLGMKRQRISLGQPYADLPEQARRLLWEGDGHFEGIQQFFEHLEQKRYKLHVRVFLSRYRSPFPCERCQGTRLRPEALQVRVGEQTIHGLGDMPIRQLATWLQTLSLPRFQAEVAHDILRLLAMKLQFLLRVGLDYLTLNRQTRTLSGGEAQRIALANQLGAQLVGTLYVLDEPTIGLHPRDADALATILHELAQAGNTVVVVEHDPHIIAQADHVVEMGPASGEKGGEVVAALPRAQFLADPRPLTARYMRGEEQIPLPKTRRRGLGRTLVIAGACAHNLKNLTVRFPLGMLIAVTGVSGSGKSTLVEETLYRAVARAFRVESLPMGRFAGIRGLEHLRGVRLIDQQPIGRTPRSNPITYLKVFDDVRRLFAATPDAKRRGLTARHFSFNMTGGRCERCQGSGYEKLEMYFFEDVYAPCEACSGRRFKPELLTIRYRGRSIDEVLQMTADEASALFADTPRLAEALRLLQAIGLGYLKLGQPATTLSGGEAQRLKIAAELTRPATRPLARQAAGLLYIMDEPTTGLHLDDIRKLLGVLGKLVDAGHTVVCVEHHLDVIKTADWVIDLGPEGGEGGGEVVAEGRPEQITQVARSITGRFLQSVLDRSTPPL